MIVYIYHACILEHTCKRSNVIKLEFVKLDVYGNHARCLHSQVNNMLLRLNWSIFFISQILLRLTEQLDLFQMSILVLVDPQMWYNETMVQQLFCDALRPE